jgi:hypothetical protein
MKKIIAAAALGILATSSIAMAQTGTTTGTSSSGSATTNAPGASTTGGAGDIADPTRRGVERSPSAGHRGGSGTPGTRTTGAGMQPSDRAMGSKSGGN